MERKSNDGRINPMIIGLLLIAAGIIWGGNALGLFQVSLFFRGWWTLFILVPCLYAIIKNGPDVPNIIGLIIGILLFLSARDILPNGTLGKLIIPVILIVAGAGMLIGKKRQKFKVRLQFISKAQKAERGMVTIFR